MYVNLRGGSDSYFEDTENSQENLNIITFESYSFAGRKIKALKIHKEIGLLTDQLAIDTLTAEVESETKPTVGRYTPITVYRDGEVTGVFFNGQIKDSGKQHYSIYAESDIALLDYDYHPGGMYAGVNAGVVIAEIMGDVPYAIHPDVAALKLYGYLPYASKRQNIQQILIATGAAIRRNSEGNMYFTALTGETKGVFDGSRIFDGGELLEEPIVTAVQVTEHEYVETNEEMELVAETFTSAETFKFAEPVHSLAITGGTILESSVNHAKIQGTGDVTLTGKKYRHTTKIITKGTVTGTPTDKTVTVTDATLITAINSSHVAQRLYDYASCNRTIQQDVLADTEQTGDIVQVEHPYKDEILSAAVHSFDFNLSNTLRASGKFLVGYVPRGVSGGYTQRVIITENTNWTVPAGVTEIRVTLVGGGQGGQAGGNGTEGAKGPTSTVDGWGYREIGDNGDPGLAGESGLPGKVHAVTLAVTPGAIYSVGIGSGGSGGASDGALGALGGNTTFGIYSSADGTVAETGYVDSLSGTKYAVTGEPGVPGGPARAPTEYMPTYGRIVYNGVNYDAGEAGDHANFDIPSTDYYATAVGGAGGGAAVGSDGANGANGSVSSNQGKGFADGGIGGRGGDATIPGDDGITPGSAGSGGHGGGAGGGGGGATNPSGLQYVWSGDGGLGGTGSPGGNGAPGCVIIYY